MKKKFLLGALVILFVGFGFSQDTGKIGFLFKTGSTSSVGLSWNVSKTLTLRPSFGFQSEKVEEVSNGYQIEGSPKNSSYNTSLGLFYHFLQKESFTAYTGLELGYLYQKIEGRLCSSEICYTVTEKVHGFIGSLILGLQYNLNKHLAVFGEVGLGYQHTKADLEFIDAKNETKNTYWDLSRSGFGIILYL